MDTYHLTNAYYFGNIYTFRNNRYKKYISRQFFKNLDQDKTNRISLNEFLNYW